MQGSKVYIYTILGRYNVTILAGMGEAKKDRQKSEVGKFTRYILSIPAVTVVEVELTVYNCIYSELDI